MCVCVCLLCGRSATDLTTTTGKPLEKGSAFPPDGLVVCLMFLLLRNTCVSGAPIWCSFAQHRGGAELSKGPCYRVAIGMGRLAGRQLRARVAYTCCQK